MSLAQRFSMVAGRAGSEEPESEEERDVFDADEDPDASKASIDSQGLDPTFSKSIHAPATAVNKPSPLRQSTLGRSMRGGRGGNMGGSNMMGMPGMNPMAGGMGMNPMAGGMNPMMGGMGGNMGMQGE